VRLQRYEPRPEPFIAQLACASRDGMFRRHKAWRAGLWTGNLRRRDVYAAVTVLVVVRSAVFVFWPDSYIDANQAVLGLMAKHLAERRAWPLFMYGQSYMLAVEAWLAAPLFLLFGASVTALKLPLLAANVSVALLLLHLLERGVGLALTDAATASLFFVLPSPATTAQLLEANGGSVETFIYVLLLWLARDRPIWSGFILGVGILQRTFTLYGYLALLLVLAGRRELFSRTAARRIVVTVVIASALWCAAESVKHPTSALGPGTTFADLNEPTQVAEIEGHLCLDPHTIVPGLEKLASRHWPLLFGTKPQPLVRYGIESRVRQGMRGAGLWLSAIMATALVRIGLRIARQRGWPPELDGCAYLILAGALSAGAYVIARCGVLTIYKMNYDLLSLLAASGVAGWYLRGETSARLRTIWVTALIGWTAIHVVAHARLWTEYATHAPVGGKRELIAALDARGVRYGIADYALSYPITFLTNERIIVASSNRVRVRQYQDIVAAHQAEAVRVARHPCGPDPPVMPHIYFCPP
jgi:hypothetical protein